MKLKQYLNEQKGLSLKVNKTGYFGGKVSLARKRKHYKKA